MIGVLSRPSQISAAREFFELFKTPWEFYRPGRRYDVVVATGECIPPIETRLLLIYGAAATGFGLPGLVVRGSCHDDASVDYCGRRLPLYGTLVTFEHHPAAVPHLTAGSETAALLLDLPALRVIRIGYDLFDEVALLLTDGQPIAHAQVPTLDLHIQMLREWILEAGIPLIEIPPITADRRFAVCLTHDIDFVGIRRHRFDHSMWGFLYRGTLGAVRELIRGRISVTRLIRMWRASASLPLVYLGLARDFWEPFGWYLQVEANLPATYYLIPFKGRRGERVNSRRAARRAASYDVHDIPESTAALMEAGCELGVHGIDAWHDPGKARDELAALAGVTGAPSAGVRMHWLLRDGHTPLVLEQAGYAYDSTNGYNETTGYRNGTTQVFRPIGVNRLLELPLHVQDGALFLPNRLDLSEADAWPRCTELIHNAAALGGVLTILWHDRSPGPERFWGDFYIRLLEALKASGGWFGTATQVVGWFQKRRDVRFEWACDQEGRTSLVYDGAAIEPPLTVRLHGPARQMASDGSRYFAASTVVDLTWSGTTPLHVDPWRTPSGPEQTTAPELCAL